MKVVSQNGLTELITKIKSWVNSTFLNKTDVVETSTLDIDSTPTASSTNLVTSGGVKTYVDSNAVLEVQKNGTALTKSAAGVVNVEVNAEKTLTHVTYTLDADVPFGEFRYIFADGLKTSMSGTSLDAKYLYMTIRQPDGTTEAPITPASLNVGIRLNAAVGGTAWVMWGPPAGWNISSKFIYEEVEDVGGMYKAKAWAGSTYDNNYVKYENMYLWNDGQLRPSTEMMNMIQIYSSGSTSRVIPTGTVIDIWYK